MSFSGDTKLELCKKENKKTCCQNAEGYGLLLFSKCFTNLDKSVTIENGTVARIIAEYAASCAGVIPQVSMKMKRGNKEAYTLSIDGIDQKEMMFTAFGHNINEEVKINENNMICSKCKSAFFRGAFISCGLITDPSKKYHLEFIVQSKILAESLADYLSQGEIDFHPSMVKRNGNFIVYIKDSVKIENILTFMGASNASMEMMQIKMYREAINDINRKSNFETANIDKTYSASANQIAAIVTIKNYQGLESLPDDLRTAAELRLDNPAMTLKEMSEALGISRSGVNHRMQKLMKIAEKYM